MTNINEVIFQMKEKLADLFVENAVLNAQLKETLREVERLNSVSSQEGNLTEPIK
jgi:hypothetical protein